MNLHRNSASQTIVSAAGLVQTDAAGRQRYDLLAAMASCLGHGAPAVTEAIHGLADAFAGGGPVPGKWLPQSFGTARRQRPDTDPSEPSAPADTPDEHADAGDDSDAGSFSADEWMASAGSPTSDWPEPLSEFAAVLPVPSAAIANDLAIQLARLRGGVSGASDKADSQRSSREAYRVITLLGSDPGDTLACRAAGDTSSLTSPLGPLVPGFRHVAPGDARALEKAIDDQTAAVLISPVNWHRGGIPWDAAYLPRVRELCDAHGLLLILDETRLPPAISGHWFHHQADGIQADLVTASAGWVGGLPGGLLLVAASAGIPATTLDRIAEVDSSLVRAVAVATADAIRVSGGPAAVETLADAWRTSLDELTAGFEFLGKVSGRGLWTVLSTDVDAHAVAAMAAKVSVRLGVTSDTTLLACPPMTATPEDLLEVLSTLRRGLEMLERETIES
ncbi:MAG: aminotransferase class III-fold pyridoxal phosphate-dependent enzyme [Planctomycetaceae bacterium]|nr:MAG: aminotransferase class III-fold pyridoxal phosphate-dependent enzyme [Planctomycetaceae bacterium]